MLMLICYANANANNSEKLKKIEKANDNNITENNEEGKLGRK